MPSFRAIVPALLLLLCARAHAESSVALPTSAVPAAAPVEISAPAATGGTSIQSLIATALDQPTGAAVVPPFRYSPAPRRAGLELAADETPGASALIGSEVWPSIAAPGADALDRLAQRIPGLARDAVRELPFDTVDAILAIGVSRKESSLDIFTDPGLQQRGQIFYLSQDTLQKVFDKYRLYSLPRFSGKAKNGGTFQMQAIVMGAGKIEMLYDRDDFEFDNPDFTDHSYRSAGRVSETIQGPGDLKVEGLSVAMFLHPKIERFLKISQDTLRVETNWGSAEKPLKAIDVRP